ncbi:DEAD/DEAH box helicase [Candidatus Woesearchaeota archaeon]|nr:DEAD/DEAH box helicase [Candidatus Woesearchaeota archaeon]
MEITNLNLDPNIMKALKAMGFTETTDIQEKCIPQILQGKDVFGQSSTGSGKTAAFGLPMLERIRPGSGLQVLIITPTRELCVQVTDAMRSFGRFLRIKTNSVYGGVSIGPQIDAIKFSEIIVGTPGRILDHIERGTIRFSNVKFLVLDEADKMFEMGFIEAIEHIIRHIPKERQTLMFSATLPSAVHQLARKHLRNPVMLKSKIYVDKSLMNQVYYDVNYDQKFSLLVHLLKKETSGLALVFCATRREVDIVAKNLKIQGLRAMAIHGGLTQNKRLHALDSLKKEDINILVATDVAARGLDISNVSHVYNYDVPKTSEDYVHRIGRTARAGMKGDAVTLLSDRDHDNFRNVLSDRTLEIRKSEVPQFEKAYFTRELKRDFRRPGRVQHRGGQRRSSPGHGYNSGQARQHHRR